MFCVTANSEEEKAVVKEKKKIQIRFPKRSFWTTNMKKKQRREKTEIEYPLTKS